MESPITVLLADDDALFLESLRTLIERQPELTVVAEAHDGIEAIDLTDELQPDAAVVDLHMPLLDGISALTRMRRDHPSLCLIALTGDADPQLHRAAHVAGADAVLEKHEIARALVDRLAGARAPESGEGRT
jgi:two-component system, NarL family, nitrate/nitrite response regulator NarL